MKRTIEVYLGNAERRVGTLRYDKQGARESSSFEYHPDWLSSDGAFAIDPNLRLGAGPQFFKRKSEGSVFPGAIADTEPDGWSRRVILRDHAKQRQQARSAGDHFDDTPLNDVDYLLAVDDHNRVGALRFKDENGVFQRAPVKGRRTTPPLVELRELFSATRAVERNDETAADLEYLRGRGTSVGGLRPKCSVVDEDGSLLIGKFPSVQDDSAVTKGEVMTLLLAKAAGINSAEARLIDSEGIPVALIRRFDRSSEGRLIYISAATLLGADNSTDHAYTEIVDGLRQHGADPHADGEELWRRIAFFILVNNVDDHLHNLGLLHVANGQWKLAPAFDINPFPDRARELKTWISEEVGPTASLDALMTAIPYFRITSKDAKRIVGEVESAVSNWRETGRAIGMNEKELDQFAPAFEHEQRRVAQRIKS